MHSAVHNDHKKMFRSISGRVWWLLFCPFDKMIIQQHNTSKYKNTYSKRVVNSRLYAKGSSCVSTAVESVDTQKPIVAARQARVGLI